MASETVNSCIEDIKKNLTQKGSSKKDEARVMKAMLSDTSYRVGVYGKDGLESEYCPAEDYKNMCAEIIADATRISTAEATKLIEKRDASKNESEAMVRLSKEFINTYITIMFRITHIFSHSGCKWCSWCNANKSWITSHL